MSKNVLACTSRSQSCRSAQFLTASAAPDDRIMNECSWMNAIWMNEWMNEWMDEWMNSWSWHTKQTTVTLRRRGLISGLWAASQHWSTRNTVLQIVSGSSSNLRQCNLHSRASDRKYVRKCQWEYVREGARERPSDLQTVYELHTVQFLCWFRLAAKNGLFGGWSYESCFFICSMCAQTLNCLAVNSSDPPWYSSNSSTVTSTSDSLLRCDW